MAWLGRRRFLVGIALTSLLSVGALVARAADPLPGNGIDLGELPDIDPLEIDTVPTELIKTYQSHGIDISRSDYVYKMLQYAVANDDVRAFLAVAALPLRYITASSNRMLNEPASIVARWSRIKPVLEQALSKTTFADAFINAEGVMFGDGEVWLGLVCSGGACDPKSLAVVTINADA